MNKLEFIRTNGNVPKALDGEDHISGLLYYMPSDEIPSAFLADAISLVGSLDTAEEMGITDTATSWHVRNLYYQLSEIFSLNDGVTLYVGVYETPAATTSFDEVQKMQRYSGGDIRQLGIYLGELPATATMLTNLQSAATTLESNDTPLSILLAPYVASVSSLAVADSLRVSGLKNISIVIGEDGEGVASTLRAELDEDDDAVSVTAIGTYLGLLSSASVHQSIGWVGQFPTGIALPAFSDGTLYRSLDNAVLEKLDAAGYIFFVTYTGYGGTFVSDSPTMDAATSDYCTIELVRTMDKAVRGVHTYLLPELGSPLYVDPSTGNLSASTVQYLETTAGYALEAMENAGELSGYSVEIDPDQDVAATSTVEFVIKNVAVGVLRNGTIKIGYTTQV